ncbi:MAG: glutamine synthetase III [Puniceicoccales bacterium]|jgi:glutamine synthetase|nr:glutamine synthetase III [Puniceicoccales bacterium]
MSGNAARRKAIEGIATLTKTPSSFCYKSEKVEDIYGINVFSLEKMQKTLPKAIFKNLKDVIENGGKLDSTMADVVASAMKDWALARGATHYAHVFYPLTGSTAEKHDSFYEPEGSGAAARTLAGFSGKTLIQGEPDASSFPNGGLRATFEARGYTVWDVTSPAFIIDGAHGATLCIPTAFVSWKGDALDKKTPLLRSMQALHRQAKRILKLFGHSDPGFLAATAGPEQEYFLIDSRLYHLRPDLYTCGRTLFGAKPARGQEFEDQYFGTIPERILAFMQEVEHDAFKLGIPLKTRHNEVAPGQYEVAPIFETANVAHDHQQLTMTIIKKVARKHGLVALLAEKPFAGVNGSGKHLNWSLGSAKVGNLLDPGETPHDNAQFLTFATAVIRAVSLHQGVLRAFVASAGNDHRLGANEAPPAIISVYLGDQLAGVFEQLSAKGTATTAKKGGLLNVGVDVLPPLAKDAGDRNRTSPFAFTGNKFEFRAVGSAFSIAGPLFLLNTIVADSLEYFADVLEKETKGAPAKLNAALQKLFKEVLTEHGKVIFNGNGYSEEWQQEAAKRGLLNLKSTPEALPQVTEKAVIEAFKRQGVLSKTELESREELSYEAYVNTIRSESKLTLEIARTQIYPAANRYISELALARSSAADAGVEFKDGLLERVAKLTADLSAALLALEKIREDLKAGTDAHKNAIFAHAKVIPAQEKVREIADALEELVSDELWPLPSYQELLYLR